MRRYRLKDTERDKLFVAHNDTVEQTAEFRREKERRLARGVHGSHDWNDAQNYFEAEDASRMLSRLMSEVLDGERKLWRDLRTLAKAFGHAHGFRGDAGGWIREETTRVSYCQGWSAFARMYVKGPTVHRIADVGWVWIEGDEWKRLSVREKQALKRLDIVQGKGLAWRHLPEVTVR